MSAHLARVQQLPVDAAKEWVCLHSGVAPWPAAQAFGGVLLQKSAHKRLRLGAQVAWEGTLDNFEPILGPDEEFDRKMPYFLKYQA